MHFLENMTIQQAASVSLLTFPSLSAIPFVKHAFSTRTGGVSKGEFSSLNLSFGRGDSDENVRENHRLFAHAIGVDPYKMTASAQDHRTNIRLVGEKEAGIGIWNPRDLHSVDGLITDTPGIALMTYYADCVPLYFVDPVHRAVGLAHAGWRGTVARIGAITLEHMREAFGSQPQDVLAAIGPSIGPCCFEVDSPVREAFAALTDLDTSAFIHNSSMPDKYKIDLWETNRRVLVSAGMRSEHIAVGGVCTMCHSELLFSHRATQGKRGGLAALISITP